MIGIVVALILAIWRCALRYDAGQKERALRHMQGRQALDDIEFGHHYFPPSQAAIAARIRQILATHISVDLSRLHPDDQLVEDIRMDALDSMSTVEFVLEVEGEFGVSIPDAVAEEMRTARDVVEYVAAHSTKKPAGKP